MNYEKGHKVTRYREGGQWEELSEDEQYILSENQAQFCNDADNSGLKIDWTYSGRGMYGKLCPAVRAEQANDLQTTARVREDSMGRGVVIYAQS